MALLLPSIIARPRPKEHFLLLQSSIAQSSLPLIPSLISQESKTLLFCLLYRPADLLDEEALNQVDTFNWTEKVPGYNDENVCDNILKSVQAAPEGRINVILDSVDTLASDIGSDSKTYKFLAELLALVRNRSAPSRLVLHILAPSSLIPLLSSIAFSSAFAHVTAHSHVLLTHLATAYLTPPPPASPPAKFWGIFLPLRERLYETEQLVFGTGQGNRNTGNEIVVEIIVRSATKKGTERVLEGWSGIKGPACELTALESLKTIWTKASEEAGPDPTQNLSFNLSLTPSQQQSRAQIPLPYMHKETSTPTPGAIIYDPDSADDIDDDDPDEDLDI